MLVYPQLATGSMAQFPIEKVQGARTVVVTAADGTKWKLPDPAGFTTEWRLTYADLSDAEAGALQQFFESAEGGLQNFTFLDPLGNLLIWSTDFARPEWSRGPMLTIADNIPDPVRGNAAWRISNTGEGPQSLKQDVAVPSTYVYCCSVYVRSSSPGRVTLLLGSHRAEREANTAWRRISIANTGDCGTDPVQFGLEFPAGVIIEVYGLQAEAQAAASGYRPTSTGGVYENARLRDNSLELTATGPDRNSCTVNIIHVKHL